MVHGKDTATSLAEQLDKLNMQRAKEMQKSTTMMTTAALPGGTVAAATANTTTTAIVPTSTAAFSPGTAAPTQQYVTILPAPSPVTISTPSSVSYNAAANTSIVPATTNYEAATSDEAAQQTARDFTIALQQRELPPNTVFANILERGEAVTANAVSNPSLSVDARMAADDLRNLLSVTRQMFATKNNDEALQRLVHYSREAAVASTGAATTTYTTGTAKDIGKKSGEMAMTTYNLVKLMARSDEFRRLMFDLVNIASDFSETGGISTESVDANAGQASSSVTAPVVLPAGKKTMADVVKAVQVEKKKGFSFRSNISDETKARFTERFKTWMTAINRREDFREGIRELIFSIDDFSQYAVDTGSDFLRNNNDVLSARENSALARAEAKKLIQRFSQGYDVDSLTGSLEQIVKDSNSQGQIKLWFTDLRSFILKSVDDPEYVQTDAWTADFKVFKHRARQIFDPIRPQMNNLTKESKNLMKAFVGDPQLNALSQSSKSFVQHLFLDDQGRPKLKPGTLLDLRNILGPLLQEELKYIYVPRLASDDENLTWVLDNVMLKGEDVMPDKITIENYNMVVMSPTSSKATDQAMGATLRIHISGIRAHLYDVRMAYSVKKVVRMEDVISFDAHMTGPTGLSFEILLSTTPAVDHVFRIVGVKAHLDQFLLQNIHGVDHSNMLYAVVKPIVQTQVKKNLESSICDAIKSRLLDLDQLLIHYKDRINVQF